MLDFQNRIEELHQAQEAAGAPETDANKHDEVSREI